MLQFNRETPFTIRGIGQSYRVNLEPYHGVDFSKLAFLFSGQGQMIPGLMADEVQNLPIFKAHFAELDKLAAELGVGTPSDFILKPGEFPEASTGLYAVLCLNALQVSMHETLVFAGYRPQVLSAHSFGEFAALTAAGVIRYPDMVRFLVERQKALATVTEKFTMFAVGDASRLSGLSLDIEYQPANYNTLRQTSFVCRSADADAFRAALKDQKIAAVKVDVDYPYHTRWLEPARGDLRRRLSEWSPALHAPKIPVLSSVSGEVLTRENLTLARVMDLLCDQLLTPVRFPEQIRAIHNFGVAHFLELSPVDVLTPFVEQVLQSDQKPFKVDSFRRKIKAAPTGGPRSSRIKNSKFLEVFNKALKSLTGYTIEDIQLEDRIREDLGIDSIKKAEIVFRMVDALNTVDTGASAPLNLAELATFGDVIDYLESSERAREKMSKDALIKTAVFSLVKPVWKAAPLVDFSGEPANVMPPDTVVIDGRGLEGDAVIEGERWITRLQKNPIPQKRWIFVHDDTPIAAALSSFFRTLAQECQATFKSMILPKGQELPENSQLFRESLDFANSEVRLDAAGQRFVRSFEPATTAGEPTRPARVLAFGGLGGVGLECLKALDHLDLLVIAGRSTDGPQVQQKLALLKGRAKAVTYVTLDAGDSAAVRSLMDGLEQQHGGFDLVLHSVGIEYSETLPNLSGDQIRQIIRAKVALGETLASWAAEHPSARVIFNSALVAQFGNIGQCPYSYANRYLNELAGRAPNIVSILWPAWRDTGMTKNDLIAKALHLQGLPVMAPADGGRLFTQALGLPGGVYPALCFDFLPDYLSASPVRHEFKGLFKPASKDRRLYALSGLTQKHLPYLTHHIVKKVCPFPASGSMALMLFRAYQERGEIGSIRKFSALNFLIVQPDSSNYFLEMTQTAPDEFYMQMRSSQILADGHVTFAGGGEPPPERLEFESDEQLKIEFDQNVSVFTGDLFKLEQGVFENSRTGRMAVRMDLAKTPVYTDIPILDKFHKLLEIGFNGICLKSVSQHGLMVVPKNVEMIQFFPANLEGHLFFVLIDDVRLERDGPISDLWIVNSHGRPAVQVKNFRAIVVSEKSGETAKAVIRSPHSERFF